MIKLSKAQKDLVVPANNSFFREKTVSLDFHACHKLASEYFYFHHENDIRSLTHNVSCSHFVMWVYYNIDDNFDPNHELQIVSDLAESYDIKNKGWNPNPILKTYKALPYELFDNVAAIIFSPK